MQDRPKPPAGLEVTSKVEPASSESSNAAPSAATESLYVDDPVGNWDYVTQEEWDKIVKQSARGIRFVASCAVLHDK